MRQAGCVAGVLVLVLALGGCGGKDDPPTPVPLPSVSVTGGSSAVAGATLQFAATGTYSDGSTHSLPNPAWTAQGNATINTAGLATGTSPGTATITASSGSVSGSTNLTITAPMLTGTAAAGLPLTGTITVKDAAGATRSMPIGANGSYSIDVWGLTPPLLLRAEGTVGAAVYVIHSATPSIGTGGTVNITPLTDLIVANVGGQGAASYYDSGNFSAATANSLAAESAALKAKLQPVLSALNVDAGANLISTPFTPLASPLDTALEILVVSIDPATHVATIRNLANGGTITDDIAVGASAETNPPVLSASATSTAAGDVPLIRKALTDFIDLFRTRAPTPAQILPMLTDDFLHGDINRADFASNVAAEEDLVGASFTDIRIIGLDYGYNGGATPLAIVSFGVSERDGRADEDPEESFALLRGTDGKWRLHGNRHSLELEASIHQILDTRSGCRAAGFDFEVGDDNPDNSASIEYVVVTGPGLPGSGLRYQRLAQSDWTLAAAPGANPFWYPLTDTCTNYWGAAGLPDATIAALPDNASYVFRAFTSAGVQVPTGIYGTGNTRVIPRRPMTKVELAASTRFPAFTTSVDLATYAGGPITIQATGVDPAREAGAEVEIRDGNGAPVGDDADITPLPNGTFSQTFTLGQATNVTSRNASVYTSDAYGRGYMSTTTYITGFTVGGSIAGVSGGSVVLRLNGSYDLAINAPGPFSFPVQLAPGTGYNVTVAGQPSAQVCGPGVANGAGTIGSANVTNIGVTCANFSIGGPVSGLTGAGLVLQLNGANDYAIDPGSTGFTFPPSTTLGSGNLYTINVRSQPAGQTCTIVNGTGTVRALAPTATNVNIGCVNNDTSALWTGTYRLGDVNGTAVPGVRAFLTLHADGTYLYGEHHGDPECGANNGNGAEYGVYRWNATTHAFAFVNAVIDTNGECGMALNGTPSAGGTLVRNANGTLSADVLDTGNSGAHLLITWVPVESIPGALIGSWTSASRQFFHVFGSDGTLFSVDIKGLTPPISTVLPGIEDGCYLLAGATVAGTFSVNLTSSCAVSAMQTAADTTGSLAGFSVYGSGTWGFQVNGDSLQVTIPGATTPSLIPLARIRTQ